MQKPAYDNNVACGLCGSKNKHQELPAPKGKTATQLLKQWPNCKLVRCRVCGLEFYSPRLSEEFVIAAYFKTPDAKTAAESMDKKGVFFGEPMESPQKQIEAVGKIHAARYERFAGAFERANGRAPKALFEIGASTGRFLTRARERAAATGGSLEAAGTDPNIYAADIAQTKHSLDVKGVPFGDYKPSGKQKNYYDIIVNGMLASSYAPLKDLQKIESMARPGAIIAIRTFISDNDPEGNNIHPVFNQVNFSGKTLQDAVAKAGLKIVEFDDKSEAAHSHVTVLATVGRR